MPEEVRAAAHRAWHQAVTAAGDYGLTISPIHADPGPDSFLLSRAGPGQDALIDWATRCAGRSWYDLASFAVLTRSADMAALWFNLGLRQGDAGDRPPARRRRQHDASALGRPGDLVRLAHRARHRPRAEHAAASHQGLAAAYQAMTAGSDAA
jgi:hypothetical protein